MICSMEREWRHGLMDLCMREIMHLGESMELGHINGMMDHNILVIGLKIRLVGLEYIHGWMGGSMRENGRIIIWRG